MILLSLILVLSVGLLYINFKSPTYNAGSVILINTSASHSTPYVDVLTLGNERNLIQNELEILQSHSLHETVAEKLIIRGCIDSISHIPLQIIQQPTDEKVKGNTSMVELVIQRLKQAVSFTAMPGTDMIRIQVLSKSPEEAALIANVFSTCCYDMNLFNSRAKSIAFRQFLEAQLNDKRRALDETESMLRNYMQEQGIVSLDDESKKLVNQLGQLESQRDETEINIQSLTKSLESYQDQLVRQQANATIAISEANDPYISRLQEQLANLEVQRDLMISQNPSSAVERGVYDEKTKEINNQINELRKMLKQRTDQMLGSLMPGEQTGTEQNDPIRSLKQLKQKIVETKVDIQALHAKKNALDTVIAQYDKQFDAIPQRTLEFAKLQRARVSSEKLYLSVQEKYNEAMITEQSEFGYIDIIEPATVPTSPSSPKKLMILLLSIVAGFGLGVVAVVARDRIDPRIYSPDELKKRGFTVLSAISKFGNGSQPRRELISTNKIVGSSESMLPVLSTPFSPMAESYRHLRTNILNPHNYPELKTILITSTKPQEGKSTTVSNLAIACAQAEKKVLVVDGDFRRPVLHTYFGVEGSPGLAELLREDLDVQSVIKPTTIENLHLLCTGKPPKNPSELLGSKKMRDLLLHLGSMYDLILFDSSPMLAVTDATVLTAQIDATLLVVAAGETTVREFEEAVELIVGLQGKKPGIILNKYDLRRAYGISYGHYTYGYYAYSDDQGKITKKRSRKKVTGT